MRYPVKPATKNRRNPENSPVPKVGKGRPRTGDIAIQERRAMVVDMYISGYTQHEIAQQLRIGITTVESDIRKVRKLWAKQMVDTYDNKVAEETVRLLRVEREAREAYTLTTKTYKFVKGKRIELPDKRPGDPKYLDIIRSCIELRLRVIGALKGTQVNVVNNVLEVWDALAASTTEYQSFPVTVPVDDAALIRSKLDEINGAEKELPHRKTVVMDEEE